MRTLTHTLSAQKAQCRRMPGLWATYRADEKLGIRDAQLVHIKLNSNVNKARAVKVKGKKFVVKNNKKTRKVLIGN